MWCRLIFIYQNLHFRIDDADDRINFIHRNEFFYFCTHKNLCSAIFVAPFVCVCFVCVQIWGSDDTYTRKCVYKAYTIHTLDDGTYGYWQILHLNKMCIYWQIECPQKREVTHRRRRFRQRHWFDTKYTSRWLFVVFLLASTPPSLTFYFDFALFFFVFFKLNVNWRHHHHQVLAKHTKSQSK